MLSIRAIHPSAMSNQNAPAEASPDSTPSQETADGQESGRLARVGRLLRAPLYNHDQGRVRAGWRVLVAVVTALVGTTLAAPVIRSPFDPLTGIVADQTFRVVFIGGILAVWARYLDRRPLAAYGLAVDAARVRNLLAGLTIGTAIPAMALGVFLLGGWAEVIGVAHTGYLTLPFAVVFIGYLLYFTLVGIWEELLFRGLFIRNAAEGFSRLPDWAALLGAWGVSSVTFALVHFSQVATPAAFLFYVLLGGGLLGTAYVVSGDLALPIGLHVAFNFASNTLFGLTGVVSDRVPSVLQLSFTGPDALVGIPGIVHAVSIVIGIFVMLGWVRYHQDELGLHTEFTDWVPRD